MYRKQGKRYNLKNDINTFIPSARHDRQLIIMSWRTFSTDHSPCCVSVSIRLLKKSKTYKMAPQGSMLQLKVVPQISKSSKSRKKIFFSSGYHVNIFNQFTEAWVTLKWQKDLLPMHYRIYNLQRTKWNVKR